MKKLSLFLMLILFATIGSAQKAGYVYTLKVANNATIGGTLTVSGATVYSNTIDPTITNTTAGGDRGINLNITQSTNALTGTLDGIYARATAGDVGGLGTVRGCEIGGRLADVASNVVSVVTGGYFWADAKTQTATTLRGVEISLDGGAGGTSTLAEGLVVFNNSSATQTTSIGVDINGGNLSGRKTFTYDFRGQNGETIDNATDGAICIRGALNFAIAGGTNVVSVGLLGGAGTSTSAYQTLGSAGGKAFSFYVGSTSTTASHTVEGFYMNVNYGTSGSSAAPSGEAGRFRAYLIGDAGNASVALVGCHNTVEIATGGSSTGLVIGGRNNVIIPNEALTTGNYTGGQCELYTSGASSQISGGANASLLRLAFNEGTAPTTPPQLSGVSVFDINLFANEVGDGLIFDNASTGNTVAGKLRILINGTTYWIMLASGHS
jgi:hypothetical protein